MVLVTSLNRYLGSLGLLLLELSKGRLAHTRSPVTVSVGSGLSAKKRKGGKKRGKISWIDLIAPTSIDIPLVPGRLSRPSRPIFTSGGARRRTSPRAHWIGPES